MRRGAACARQGGTRSNKSNPRNKSIHRRPRRGCTRRMRAAEACRVAVHARPRQARQPAARPVPSSRSRLSVRDGPAGGPAQGQRSIGSGPAAHRRGAECSACAPAPQSANRTYPSPFVQARPRQAESTRRPSRSLRPGLGLGAPGRPQQAVVASACTRHPRDEAASLSW